LMCDILLETTSTRRAMDIFYFILMGTPASLLPRSLSLILILLTALTVERGSGEGTPKHVRTPNITAASFPGRSGL